MLTAGFTMVLMKTFPLKLKGLFFEVYFVRLARDRRSILKILKRACG